MPAWRVDLLDGDPAYVDGDPSQGNFPERAQQNALHPEQRFDEGDERYISFQVYLPESYPLDDTHRQTIMQMKRGCNGPPVALEATSGLWRVITQGDNVCGTSNPITRNTLTAVEGRWARFTFRIKFSPDPSVGYLEIHADNGDGVWRTLQPLTRTHTMKQSNGVASWLGVMLGYYRWEGQTGSSYMAHDGLTVATTRAAAEANAFGTAAVSAPSPVVPSPGTPAPPVRPAPASGTAAPASIPTATSCAGAVARRARLSNVLRVRRSRLARSSTLTRRYHAARFKNAAKRLRQARRAVAASC